ncbi:hypothetical protein F4778DRAFT_774083 [Xylariomycetidae sp. FL2044]|nr:hypothetical protein F4778DRAFT_774083 [Xylariomycetidae sp. FL2044]
MGREDGSCRPQQIVRVAAIAVTIISARHLFAHGFHYPLLILIAHTSLTLLIQGLRRRASKDGDDDEFPRQGDCHVWRSRARQLLFAAIVAVALLFTYHSMLHSRNTTLNVMVLCIAGTNFVGKGVDWLTHNRPSSFDVPLSIATCVLSSALLLASDNWLVGKGVEYLIIAAVCVAIARHLWDSGFVEREFVFGPMRLDVYTLGLAVCVPLSLFLLFITSWYNRRDFHVRGRIPLIIVNLVAGVISLQSNISPSRPTSILGSWATGVGRSSLGSGHATYSLLVVALVEIDNQLAQVRPTSPSVTQWLAFAIAYLATMDVNMMASLVDPSYQTVYERIPGYGTQEETGGDSPKTPTIDHAELSFPTHGDRPAWRNHITKAWHFTLGSLAILLLAAHTFGGRASPEATAPPRDLDIVIAWYDEPVDQVIKTAQVVLGLPAMEQRKMRTIVYNKGHLNETELVSKFPTESELVIRQLENVGREGETYLSHILDEKQDWASHTVFMQAEPHQTGYIRARLRDYLVANTGFLSLGSARNYCLSCETCNDHSGWIEEGTTIRDLYDRANPRSSCEDLSLTYRGQFVVSARRMKQADRALFSEMRDRVIAEDQFGYTLERFWGVVFGCPRISQSCPTLLSQWMGSRGAVEDCQCLDA